ncbi:hypothetical protein GO495_11510 [Chitinophaga oryziterrae]|uniref:Uncharacterized protein n=1 Tax=Chitinophaga oryziterrae TaxID=1031224 RepID=A0A6N8J9E0_9BACT|nr:hypothetical protein [Chitinophaga oryziterrae]MVT41211.1 hypothetical protein [Chitinophaga oryziterrae]
MKMPWKFPAHFLTYPIFMYFPFIIMGIFFFMPLALIFFSATKRSMKKSINAVLNQYNYKLVAFRRTSKRFTPPNFTMPTSWSWQRQVSGIGSPSERIQFREISFKTSDNRIAKSLVMIVTQQSTPFTHKLFFQKDLKQA